MTSRYLTSYQPPRTIPQVEYEMSHYQNCGQDRPLVASIGTFPTLQDAQDFAQDVLGSVLNQYKSRGWSGYYCNDIDLEFQGLIARLVGEQEYEYLSEVQIHAREKAYQLVQSPSDSVETWMFATGPEPVNTNFGYNTTHSTYDAFAPTDMLTPWRPTSTLMQSQQVFSSYARQSRSSRRTDSSSQTRPRYPDRPGSFIPRTSARYGQTMGFSAARNHDSSTDQAVDIGHMRQDSRTHRHGNSLGGGYDIGGPYLGWRHSSIDLSSENKHFQYTVDGY